MIHRYLFVTILIAISLYAWRRGGAPERWGAGIVIAGYLLTLLLQRTYAERFGSLALGVLLVDFGVLAAFFILSLKANRFWPIWMTGFQAVSVMMHGAIAISPGVIPWAYAFGLAMWSYPILIMLAGATWRHRQRIRTRGVDRSWSDSSDLSQSIRRPRLPR